MKSKGICGTACVVVALLSGCRPAPQHQDPSPGPATSAAYDKVPDPATTGTLTGNVTLEGATPARIPIDMSQDPACALAGGTNLSEQYVVDHGHLANVFVYIKGAPRLASTAPPVVMDQKGCRFVPHVVAVPVGGTVQFANGDPTMHNVHMMAVESANQSIDISQMPGAPPASITYKAAENMVPVRCNNHPWMNAFVNVSPNTFYAVTGPDGSFKITGLPKGRYTAVFVQEKLGELDLPLIITAQANTAVNATFKQKQGG